MRIEYLEYLVDFADTQSISKTASHFFLSYQGMSRALRELQKEISADLFGYQGRSVYLNDLGKAYVESVRPIVEQYHESQRVLANQLELEDREAHDAVYLRFTPTSGRCLLPLMFESYPYKKHLRVDEVNLTEGIEKIRCREYGKSVLIATIPAFGVPQDDAQEVIYAADDLIRVPLVKTESVVLVHAHSRFAKKRSMQRDELSRSFVGCLGDQASLDVLEEFVPMGNLFVTGVWTMLANMVSMDRLVVPVPKLVLAKARLPENVVAVPLLNDDTPVAGPVVGLMYPTIYAEDRDVQDSVQSLKGLFELEDIKSKYGDYYTQL